MPCEVCHSDARPTRSATTNVSGRNTSRSTVGTTVTWPFYTSSAYAWPVLPTASNLSMRPVSSPANRSSAPSHTVSSFPVSTPKLASLRIFTRTCCSSGSVSVPVILGMRMDLTRLPAASLCTTCWHARDSPAVRLTGIRLHAPDRASRRFGSNRGSRHG